MTDEELRTLVRAAIARHTAGGTFEPAQPPPVMPLHPSHGVFTVPAGSEMDGPCIIEPAVLCNHCGYCKSYGH
ncbi:MAG: hypothetical protein ACRD3C_16435 [Vicinamibacterales bacterium]